ncbi:hypothetical protein FA13DRAFT_1526508 [Coprinellus micaceus]|uniref:MYND-type domain-containing protein n=1 Tax=Coprinellus micaceus TaxID=71717 RepID=A0A4Y7SK34_COPMI|nr:hypothetical protein FA13DRAFT_1526508 [Coprinellus micaceus]
MLDVAIAWWTVLYNESPVVYPGRERSHNANEDGAGDAAMSIMHKLAKENPKAISKAIISGRMCDLQTFVERSLQRMWCMLRIKQISHLVDYPEATVENVNLRSLFLMTHTLMLTDPRIHDAFMKKQASSVYLTVLSSTTGRLYSRITSPGSTNISNRRDQIHHINEIVDLALLPVQWVASTSFRARKNMVEATKHAMGVLGDCIQILDEGEVIFESIFDQLKPYTPNRKVFPIMAAGLSTMGQRTATLPDSSARKVYVCTGLGFTWGWGEMLVDERQESLCDNMKHKDRVVVSEKTSDLPERSCSRCHSVVYCSVECQSEDWQTFHRAECSHMRKQYKDCKRRQRQYSYRDRKLHVNLLRYCFESNDVCLRTAAVNRGTPELYQATLARRNTQIVFKDNDIEPGPGDEAGVYLQKVLPSIPLHLHGRFAAIVSIFSQAVEKARVGERTRARGRGNNMKFINNGVGSIRLVEKFFRYGDEDINLVLLLEQAKTLPLFTGGTVMEADRAADEFTRRDVGETHFNIISSMAYTWSVILVVYNLSNDLMASTGSARRKAKPMSWDGIEWQPPEERMVPLGY